MESRYASSVPDSLEVITIHGLCATKVHGDAMLNDSELIEDLVENLERTSTIDHVVLRGDLKPVQERLFERMGP